MMRDEDAVTQTDVCDSSFLSLLCRKDGLHPSCLGSVVFSRNIKRTINCLQVKATQIRCDCWDRRSSAHRVLWLCLGGRHLCPGGRQELHQGLLPPLTWLWASSRLTSKITNKA
ncbi:hypothetical protein AOLI_G00127620 [Acnodon oligacanthus]